jgi:hypothetical protein
MGEVNAALVASGFSLKETVQKNAVGLKTHGDILPAKPEATVEGA